MNNDEVLSLYESVAEITNQMLEAAKKKDWDRLAELENLCKEYVHKMRMRDEHKPLSGEALDRKVASIKKILADDREIRNLVDPWMVKLTTMINAKGADRGQPNSMG